MLSLVLATVLLTPTGDKPRLVVLDFAAQNGVDAQVSSALTDAITAEVSSRGYFQVTSSKDVQTLLGVERQRQMLGCTEEGCLTELAGAIGARFVLSGSVAKLGGLYQLSMQTLDSQKATPVARSMRLAKDLETLRAQLPYAVAEATGTPLPPPPSRVLPYSLVAGGGLLLVGGGVIGLGTFAQENQLQREIDLGLTHAGVLKPLDYYQQQKDALAATRNISFALLLGGAALTGLGVYLNPSDGAPAKVALVPSANGFAVVGTLP